MRKITDIFRNPFISYILLKLSEYLLVFRQGKMVTMLQQTAHLLVVILDANRLFFFFSQNFHVKHFLFWLVSIVGKLNSLCGKETSQNHIVFRCQVPVQL